MPEIVNANSIQLDNSESQVVEANSIILDSPVKELVSIRSDYPFKQVRDIAGIGEEKKVKNVLSLSATHDMEPSAVYGLHDQFVEQYGESNLYDKAVGSFKAGWGDIYSSIGGILKRKNIAPDLADMYLEFGNRLKHAYIPPTDKSEFTWRKMIDPEWYATTVIRSVPFALSLAPAAVIGAYGGVGVAGAFGLGAFGTTVLGAIGGATLSRPIESAFEAQGAHEEAIQKGMSPEEAEKAANQVFWDNMKLSGLDAAEFATAFLPMGKVAGSAVKKSLSKRILAATGKLSAVGLMEAGEERYQEKAVMDVVGDPVSFFDFKNPRMNEAGAAGAVFGVGLGGAGSVWTALQNKVTKTMPEPVKQVYEQAKKDGMSDIQALDAVAEIPEGKEHIKTVIQEMKDLAEGEEIPSTVKKTQGSEVKEAAFDEAALDSDIDRVFSGETNIDELTLSELPVVEEQISGKPTVTPLESENMQVAETSEPQASIADNLKTLNDKLGEKGEVDITPLIDIGKTIWNEGATSLEQFTDRAKEILGDTWDKVKDFIKQVWEQIKAINEKLGERGSFSKKRIREVTGQIRTEDQIKESTALKAGMKKAEQGAKAGFKAGVEEGVKQANTPIPDTVKQRIRKATGQVSLADFVREDEALYAAFKKAEQAGRAAYRAGNKEGMAEQKAIIKELVKQAQQKAIERESMAKDVKAIKKLAEMKGDIAVDYQKKIKELIGDLDFTKPTEATQERLKGLQDYIDKNGVPLGINPKRIAELKRLSLIPIKDLNKDDIKLLRGELEHLTQLGKLKARLKYKYNSRERAKIEKEILDTTNNLDPHVIISEDRYRDKAKLAGINFYLDTLHTPRVTDMADQFKGYEGAQTRLKKMTGQAETEAVATSMKRGLAFLDFLQKEGIEVISEESESDIRMNIVMRYREGARVQTQTLMDHYKIKDLPVLTDQEEKIIGWIQKDMEANKGKLAAAWEEVENEIFPEQDVYYLPLKYVKEEELIPDTQVEGRGRTTHTFDGFSHKRRPGVKKIPRVGLLQLYQEAVLEQEWYTQIQPVIADIKSVVLTDEYKEAAGEVLYNWWKDDLDILSRRGWSASAQLNSLSSLMRGTRHNINTAILAFKISTVILQPFAVFDGIAYVNAKYGMSAAAKVLGQTTKNFIIPGTTKELVEKSDALQQRQGGELAITEEMKRAAKGEGIKDKLTRIGFNLISKADVMTAAGTQEAIRKILINEGVPSNEAQKEAEFVMHMSQGSSSIAYRPHILAKGEGYRTWFTFQTFIMNRWGIIIHDLLIGKITKGDFKGKLAGLISIGILMMAGAAEDEAREWVYALVNRKELPKNNRSIPEKVLVNLFSTMPVFGNLIDATSMRRQAGPPLMRTTVIGIQGVDQLFTGKDAKSQFKGAMKATETGLTIGLGYPGTAQFFDLLEGILINESKGGRK